ncbi:MAG: RNA methyltransferase [Planctomycetota bacterium]
MGSAEINTILVNDPGDARLVPYRQLRENRLPRPSEGAPLGVFIAEGEKVVRRFAEGRARFALQSVLLAESRFDRDRGWLAGMPEGTPVYLAERGVMDRIVGFPIHRGVLAAGIRLPDPPLAELLAEARTLIILEGLANHDNVGGIFRAIAALGPSAAVLLDPTSCDPLYRKAIRVSMGHALSVPFARAEPWPDALDAVRDAGFEIAALSLGPGSSPIMPPTTGARPTAWLLGAEGPGLSAEARAAADRLVRIPMQPGVDSLNVVTAAAIALHCAHAGLG